MKFEVKIAFIYFFLNVFDWLQAILLNLFSLSPRHSIFTDEKGNKINKPPLNSQCNSEKKTTWKKKTSGWKLFWKVLERKYSKTKKLVSQPAILCSKLTTEALKQGVKYFQSIFDANGVFLVPSLTTLSIFHTLFYCFYC